VNVNGRLTLITGASSGVGAAAAKAFARRGGRVLLVARTKSALEQVAAEISAAGGEAHVYPADVSDRSDVERLARTINEDVGTPDILVNNAGSGRWLFVEETDPADVAPMMAVPYFAAFYVTRAFLPDMLRRRSGHIVNMTSPAAYMPWPGATAYTATRWAMRGFNAALRADLKGTGIGVTLVSPGKVSSAYFANNPGSEERIPSISRFYGTLTSEQVGAAIVRAVEREQREVIMPLTLRLTVMLHNVLPRPIDWMVVKTGWHRPKQG
jgi:short-subunit dehydrogenase